MKKTTIAKIMHKDVMSVRSTTSAQQCAVKMTKERVGCLIVLEKREPVGIITERGFADLVKKGNFDCKKVTAQDFMTKPIISVDIDATKYIVFPSHISINEPWNLDLCPFNQCK